MKTLLFLRRLGACVAGLALAWWLAGSAALAGNQNLAEAIGAYENFEYEDALRLLGRAAREPGLSEAERARIHLYTGLIQFTLGQAELAEREFKAALGLDYSSFPPQDTSPKIISAFEAVKKTVPPPKQPDPPIGSGVVGGPEPLPVKPPGGRLWTWVAAGVGGAALIGGGVFGGLAMKAKGDFDSQEWAGPAADLRADVESHSLAANVLFGIGGAALLTGVILFFVEDPGPDEDPPTPTGVLISPGPLSVQAIIRF